MPNESIRCCGSRKSGRSAAPGPAVGQGRRRARSVSMRPRVRGAPVRDPVGHDVRDRVRRRRLPWRPWTRSAQRSGSAVGRRVARRRAVRPRAPGRRATGATSSTGTGTGPLEAIVADLDTRRHPFHVAIENWAHDLNIGSVVRTANAFLAAEVHIVGNRRWNRRGAMVTDRYQHVRHHPTVDDLVAWAAEQGLPVLGVDNLPGSVAAGGLPAAARVRAAVRAGVRRAVRRGPRGRRRRPAHRPVRLDPLDQRGRGRGDRDARLDRAARELTGRVQG